MLRIAGLKDKLILLGPAITNSMLCVKYVDSYEVSVVFDACAPTCV
jgi:hypothetical protein